MWIERASPRPQNLGVENGRFAPCPASPNCVSTQASPDDTEHYISAIPYNTDLATAHDTIIQIIQQTPRTTIITNSPDYIYAEFRTPLWRFIDDVEFYFDDENKLIHFRSASRLGYGDMGTNRKRMEAIRTTFLRQSDNEGS
ncbi:MAG: DUF1499 domain-containing protein [Chloroflexi bacterium]|nr:MAG: DUF1499 domain-containing protein [Chloroflexota bacterium]